MKVAQGLVHIYMVRSFAPCRWKLKGTCGWNIGLSRFQVLLGAYWVFATDRGWSVPPISLECPELPAEIPGVAVAIALWPILEIAILAKQRITGPSYQG